MFTQSVSSNSTIIYGPTVGSNTLGPPATQGVLQDISNTYWAHPPGGVVVQDNHVNVNENELWALPLQTKGFSANHSMDTVSDGPWMNENESWQFLRPPQHPVALSSNSQNNHGMNENRFWINEIGSLSFRPLQIPVGLPLSPSGDICFGDMGLPTNSPMEFSTTLNTLQGNRQNDVTRACSTPFHQPKELLFEAHGHENYIQSTGQNFREIGFSSFNTREPRLLGKTAIGSSSSSAQKPSPDIRITSYYNQLNVTAGETGNLSEDEKIIELVGWFGDTSRRRWTAIAQYIPGRNGKQCRERWVNHLDPAIRKDPWTQEEDFMVHLAHEKLGNSWAEISKLLPGRQVTFVEPSPCIVPCVPGRAIQSQNSIKNRWNTTIKKKLKEIEASSTAWYAKHATQVQVLVQQAVLEMADEPTQVIAHELRDELPTEKYAHA
ncbi:hypothetical protein R1flu_027055 [Riccia fluitans]|uniref:Uncharacterized protein n=1 Tax=Riccia fluitans TaxID=41844 RepID=A0ABD1XHP0_9MARC